MRRPASASSGRSRGTYALLRYGTVTTPAGLPFPQRLNILFEDMTQLLEVTKPEAVAVEELFWGHNITTGIGVSHGRGVILLAIERAGVPLFEYTPMQVKRPSSAMARRRSIRSWI